MGSIVLMPKWTTTGEPADAKLPLLSNGACAEVSAADSLIRQGVKPENIRFIQAVRPREVWGKDTISLKAIKETCDNCLVTWPTGVDK